MTKSKIIAVDFDGTLCENKWPNIGAANGYLIDILIRLQREKGFKLILWTCRTGQHLDDAVAWCEKRGLIFNAVNENLPEMIDAFGGDTRKIVATYYLDDKSIGALQLGTMAFGKEEVIQDD